MWTLEVTLPLLGLHRSFFVVIDGAVLALAATERDELFDDFGQRVGVAADGPRARQAAERAHTDLHQLRLFAGHKLHPIMDQRDGTSANNGETFLDEVQRNNGDLLRIEAEPDVKLCPVGQRKNADAFALAQAGVVETPQFGPLVLGVPLAGSVAEAV